MVPVDDSVTTDSTQSTEPLNIQLARIPQIQNSESPSSEAQRSEHPESGLYPKYRTPKQRSSKIRTPRERTNRNTSRLSPRIYTPALGARASAGARAGPQHPGHMSGVRQRIPTLNLILNLNPKLDLIPKLITVATPPDTRPAATISAR